MDNDMPIISATIDPAEETLYRELFKNNVAAILPTPVNLPVFYEKKGDARKNKLSTTAISALYTGSWMRKHMNFNGLTLVDIDKANASTDYKAGEAELLALRAGNDMLITTDDVGLAIRRIKKYLRKEEQYLPTLDSTVKRILAAKYDAGLRVRRASQMSDIVKRMATPDMQIFKQHLYEAAITVVRNSSNLLPLKDLENKNIAFVTARKDEQSDQLHRMLTKYVDMPYIVISGTTDHDKIAQVMKGYDVVIAGVFPDSPVDEFLPVLKNLMSSKSVITCDFGHPTFVEHAGDFTASVVGYTNEPDMVNAVPQMIFGGIGASGALPYAVSTTLPEGTGAKIEPIQRFRYTHPEEARMDSRILDKIEQIAYEAIQTHATPGCQVLVAKDGKVVYDRSFGYLTYEKKAAVTDETIYDLASVTKVSATLQAVMFMYEKGMIDINKKASYYLPELKNSNKKDYTLKDILTHQAGLWPFLPFWAQTVKDNDFNPAFYSHNMSDDYPYTVADKLYASRSMRDSLWNWIVKAKVRDKPSRTPFDYRYSDMGFYILQHLAEKVLNQPIDDFLEQNLYGPLGASTTGYLPLQRFDPMRIAPTENDRAFRKSLLIGMVHDQGAAMMGGVAGHAGLFSDATDLAKLGQMLLQEGTYGGYQFYKPETVRAFTQQQFASSRRGLGWDKPTDEKGSPASHFASPKTFGHTGFTGTCIWVDPQFNIVYVFLSNRVHPDGANNKLNSENIRSRIQDVIYESIFEYCRYN
jgi:CubicO group peptidase (beta-lactamase class C family)